MGLASCSVRHVNAPAGNAETRLDFSDHIKNRASRLTTELAIVFGGGYSGVEPNTLNFVKGSLERKGRFNGWNRERGERMGNEVYRVNSLQETREILSDLWPKHLLDSKSKLAGLFHQYPRASVALMDCDFQSVFFFDSDDRLVAEYHP